MHACFDRTGKRLSGGFVRPRFVNLVLGLALVLVGLGWFLPWRTWFAPPRLLSGIIWQPLIATVDIAGNWDKLGASELLVLWTCLDGKSFLPGAGLPLQPALPDWQRIARQPWAKDVILGLAGDANEPQARRDIEHLGELSVALARVPTPLHVVGWYFPVEIDPTWKDAPKLAPVLAKLPRPLWVSVYDTTNKGGTALAQWLNTWLPRDVGVLFQDGVGVFTRNAQTARQYVDALAAELGKKRVRIIAEAFRLTPKSGFRPATLAELQDQFVHYTGYTMYAFEGPHYLPDAMITKLQPR